MTPIFSIAIQPFFSKKLAAKATDFNNRAAQWDTRRANDAQSRAKLRQSPVDLAAVDFDSIHAGCAGSNHTSIRQEELKLRREWIDLRTEVDAAYAQEYTQAHARGEEKAKDVAKRLESIGYLPFDNVPVPGSWYPGMVNTHPDLLATRSYSLELQDKLNDSGQARENQKALEAIEAELASIREELVPQ